MKCFLSSFLLLSLSLCVGAQGLPGRLPGTLPGQQPQQPPTLQKPAPAKSEIPAASFDITAIDKAKSVVKARERAPGSRTVEFKVADAALLQRLRVGQDVHANFTSRQVSVDGKTMCCSITNVEAAPAVATKTPPTSLPSRAAPTELPKTPAPIAQAPSTQKPSLTQAPSTQKPSLTQAPTGRQPPPEPPKSPLAAAAGSAAVAKGALDKHKEPLPQVTAGTPRMVQASGQKVQMQAVQRTRNPNILQLNGIEEIRGATSLSQGARDMLVLHARTLESHDMDGYIVNRQLAEEWFKKQPKLPDSVHEAAKDKGKKKKKGCSTKHISMGCAKNEVSQAVDDLTETWRKAYRDTTAEVGRAWNKAQDCFSDHTLPTLKVPVKFSVVPEFPVNVSKGGVKGNVTVGVPIAGDFTAELKMFYIPCLPFAVRPKTLGADGTMETGGTLRANLTLTGEFDHTFMIPPERGVKIPIQIIPIVIGGVPVAEMDVSVYVEGNVKIHGKGKLQGDVKLQSTQKTAFDFDCSGHGCNLQHKGMPSAPSTAMESIKLDGTLHVKPSIYTALQLSFNWELLEARAGPQPFLLGELYGCAAAAGTQSSTGASTSTGSQSIVADLDWGLDIRAEALAATKQVAHKKYRIDVSHGTTGKNAHLYFKDLVNSTGLIPVVTLVQPAAAGQPAAFKVTMPECYPYRDSQDNTLQYKVTWTGGASGTGGAPPAGAADLKKVGGGGLTKTSGGSSSSTCTFQGGQGTCSGAPKHDTAFHLTWPTAGDYVLTVAPVSDKHGHKFDASRAKQLNVKVQ